MLDLDNTYFVIWTTTAWTLPGNLAICLGPNIRYVAAKLPTGEIYIIAKELVEAFKKASGFSELEEILELPGSEFELMVAEHPFLNRDSLIINMTLSVLSPYGLRTSLPATATKTMKSAEHTTAAV